MKRSGFKPKRPVAHESRAPSGPTIRGYTAPAQPFKSSAAPRETGELLDKALRLRSRKYLDIVKNGPCEVEGCLKQADDPHHVKVRGRRGDDFDLTAIPLCRAHHDDAHAGRIIPAALYEMLGRFLCRKRPVLGRREGAAVLRQMLAGIGEV